MSLFAGASIVGRYPMTFCETWTLLRTEILNPVQPLPFCFSFARSRTRIQGKYFFLASAKISSAFTSMNVLARRAITSVVQRDNRDYWRINSTFACPSLLDSRGRREVRTNMPDLDSNAIYTRCDVPAPERVSSDHCYPTQALCWHRPGYFQANEPHHQVSQPFFVGNLRIHEPMPTVSV